MFGFSGSVFEWLENLQIDDAVIVLDGNNAEAYGVVKELTVDFIIIDAPSRHTKSSVRIFRRSGGVEVGNNVESYQQNSHSLHPVTDKLIEQIAFDTTRHDILNIGWSRFFDFDDGEYGQRNCVYKMSLEDMQTMISIARKYMPYD